MNQIIKIILTSFLFSLTLNAQKIKVKKGNVLKDKVAVASMEDLGSTYTFSNLNEKDKPKFSAKLSSLKISETVSKKWLTVFTPDESKKTEVEMEYFSVTMSNKKAVAEYFFKKYKIITDSGIDEKALNDFFAIERPSLTDEYNELIKAEVAGNKLVENVKVVVDAGTKRIFKGDNLPYTTSSIDKEKRKKGDFESRIGSYMIVNANNQKQITLMDLDNKKVAIASPSYKNVSVSLPYKESQFEYVSKDNFDQSTEYHESQFMEELISRLILEGVGFEHQIRDQRAQQSAAKNEQLTDEYNEAKKNSSNIYFTKGYVIDEKDGKIDGEIQYIVEKIQNPADFKNVVDLDEANIGKKVVLRYKNAKGKTRFNNYRSKKGGLFCIEQNVCFRGLSVKGKGLELAAGAASGLSFDTSSFYLVVSENDNFSIYKEYNKERDEFIIKTKAQKKAYKFNTKNREKNIEKLTEYLEGKVDASDLEGLNYSNLTDIQTIAGLYNK